MICQAAPLYDIQVTVQILAQTNKYLIM